MSERPRPSYRLLSGLALALVAIIEIQALAATLAGQIRARENVTRGVRATIESVRSRLAVRLRPGGSEAWAAAVRDALESHVALEAAVLDRDGRLLFGSPGANPLVEALSREDRQQALSAPNMTSSLYIGEAPRLFNYLAFPSGEGVVLLGLSSAVPELVQDLRERRPLFVEHAVALTLLAAAAGLLLFPGSRGGAIGPAALGAYQAAMERLHERSLIDQQQLKRFEDELQQKAAFARSGELAAGIAHEMRNGINTILGYARLIERGGPGFDAQGPARAVREECETLEIVIRRFTDFVKDEKLEVSHFDLERMLKRVVARESRQRPEPRIEISVVSKEAASPPMIDGDEELLERAFENLVRNALEAAGEVRVTVLHGGESCLVEVEDDGPGMSAEIREAPRAFSSTKAGGLGLGLPLAVKIVRLHGGELSLHERQPHGLIVRVQLPKLLRNVTKAGPGEVEAGGVDKGTNSRPDLELG